MSKVGDNVTRFLQREQQLKDATDYVVSRFFVCRAASSASASSLPRRPSLGRPH